VSHFQTLAWAALGLLLFSPIARAEAPDLQSEPAGQDAPDRTVDIQHLALDLTVDLDAGTVAGSATLTARPLRPGLREIVLHQVGLDVQGATVNGVEAAVRTGPTTLGVAVSSPAVGTDMTIRVRYRAQPSIGMHFRRPGPDSPDTYVEAWTQGEDVDNRHWIPVWDFPTDRFTYEGRFTVPDKYTALSNGVLESKAPSATKGWTTWHYALRNQDLVSYLVMFAAAEYQVWTDDWRGRSVGYYASPDTDEASTRLLLGKTPKMLEWMSTFLGVEYPYPVYNQVTVQRFIYTGMENTTATVLDRRLLLPPAPHRPSKHTEGIIAHELAHQWFGDQLTCRTWAHMWLNEGMTTWTADEWLRAEWGDDEWASSVFARYAGLVRADDGTPHPMVGTFFNRSGSRRSAHVYTKGATVTHMLRVLLGDDAFFRGIKGYLTKNQHGLVETEDLRRAMEDASGLHLRWFFDQWVYLAGHPKLTVTHAVDAEAGQVRVSIAQTQKTDGLVPSFHIPLDLEIATTTGTRMQRVVLDGPKTAVALDLGGAELLYVGVDPYAGVLMDLDQKQSAVEWANQLQSPNAFTRRRAVEGLKDLKGTIPDTTRALVAGLAKDTVSPGTARRLAVSVVGAWRDEAARDVLLEVLASEPIDAPYSALRAQVAEELAKVESTPEVVSALVRVLARDRDHRVRAEALKSLTALEERRVRPRAIAALRGTPSDGYWVQIKAAEALGTWGEPEDMGALTKAFQPGAPGPRFRHTALRAGAKLANRQPVGVERNRARGPVREAAEAWLKSLHLRDRQVALGVLGSVGDAGSVQRIEELLRWDDTPSMADRGASIIEKIRSRTEEDADETTGELTAKLKKLEEQLETMDADLKKLQERR
jgi:aminopeptidase N